jgi:WD40 repeat protein
MAIVGTIAASVANAIVGLNTDPKPPFSAGGGGGAGIDWDVTSIGAEGNYIDVTSFQSDPRGIWFKPNGLIMYVLGIGGKQVSQWDLGTAYDPATAVYRNDTGLTLGDFNPEGCYLTPDGDFLMFCGDQGNTVRSTPLSTPWDITTYGTYTSLSVGPTPTSAPSDLTFNSDGTIMWVFERGFKKVFHFDCSTPYDVTTGVYDAGKSYTIPTAELVSGFFINNDQQLFVLAGGATTYLELYDFTAGDISTASLTTQQVFTLTPTSPYGLWMNADHVMVGDRSTDGVTEYPFGPHS